MKTFVQKGNTLTFTNGSGSTIASGEGVLLGAGGLFGVSNGTVLDTEDGEATISGVFKISKTAADTPAQWANAYWDDTAKKVTTVSTSNTLIGVFTKSYTAIATPAEILLIPAVA